MRGPDLLSRSHSPKLLADPELAELSVQINQMWPSLPEPLPWRDRGPPWSPLIAVASPGSLDRSGPSIQSVHGRTVIPHKQRAKLKRIAKLGVPFQRLAIAHELIQRPRRSAATRATNPAATLH